MQRVECLVVRRDSSAISFGRDEITLILTLFHWLTPLTDEGGGKPPTTSSGKRHNLEKPENQPPTGTRMPHSKDRYYGGRRQSSDDSFHSPAGIPPSALDKLSIMKRYHRLRTTRWGVTGRSPTMVTLHDIRFVECRWWNDGWTVKTVVTWLSSASMIPAPGLVVGACLESRRANLLTSRCPRY